MSKHLDINGLRAPNTIALVASANSQRTNEDATLNSKGSAASDDSGRKQRKFLSCKEIISISTMKVRMLLKEGKTNELVANFNNYQHPKAKHDSKSWGL